MFVEIFYCNLLGSLYSLMDPGEAETSLFLRKGLLAQLCNASIDHHGFEVFALGEVFCHGRGVNHKKADRLANLGGSQSDSVAFVHTLPHLGNKPR